MCSDSGDAPLNFSNAVQLLSKRKFKMHPLMVSLKFDLKLFLVLTIAFVFTTIIGTISHEFGHFVVAKYSSYSASMSYGYTNWEDKSNNDFIDSSYKKYSKEIELGIDFPEKKKLEILQKRYAEDNFWITLGGPLQTMLTGCLGFLILLFQYKKIRQADKLSNLNWLFIFLSLFWLRQTANFFTWLFGYFYTGNFSSHSDEIIIALDLNLPTWIFTVISAIIGLLVLAFIIFKIIPINKRLTFILSGLLGGAFGYYFWLFWVGPILMP